MQFIKLAFSLFLIFFLSISASFANDSKLQSAIESDIRSGEDKARDTSRKPAETLEFFGVTETSNVLELIPGGGWYTKILGTYLKESGQLSVAIGADAERLQLEENDLEHVKIIGEDFELTSTDIHRGIRDVVGSSFGEEEFDLVLTFRNIHNLSEQGRAFVNTAVFNALKPGGVYGVIDHTKRHMESFDTERWRRVDPVQVIKEMLEIGFVFEDYSDLHARPNDGLIYDSTHESINRDSDRFTLKFRKPL
ncbi:MAG: hypothetical protein KTR16_01525 [Acidiferrobacterales bacterium]|nr:hypothetical protein [Acidiferrobacterales bacterium]